VVAVREQHPTTDRVIVLKLVVRGGQLVDQREIEGVALLGPTEPYQEQMPVALNSDGGSWCDSGSLRFAFRASPAKSDGEAIAYSGSSLLQLP
jgi:hypothetical protein